MFLPRIITDQHSNVKRFVCQLAIAISVCCECDAQEVKSFRALIKEDDAVLMPRAEGKWLLDLSSEDTLTIERKGDNFYALRTARSSIHYEAMFARFDGLFMMQLLPVAPVKEESFKDHFIPVYTFYRAEFVNDSLRLSGINYSWLFEQVKNKSFTGEYSWSGDAIILNMGTDNLVDLVRSSKTRPEFFGGIISLSPIAISGTPAGNKAAGIVTHKVVQPKYYHPKCTPSFPLKEGWWGGDGNVSVPISNTKTLWLFSDSFVGQKDQASREGTSIVANTVGVMTCDGESETTMEYYWTDKFTSYPKPIFRTFTDRYKYWIADALLCDSVLYIVLDKIGARPDPVPADQTFNFDHVGWSIVKVSNPYASPDQWQMTYFPLPGIGKKQWAGQFVLESGYVYMFFRQNDSSSILTRYPVDFMERPLEKIEYYVKTGLWKSGMPGEDAAIVLSGDDCQTVEYHMGIRRWIMISGPGFLNNKIRIRKAPALTGPWSHEELIYECPEQTPGSPLYHKNNFCYLGREHIQFYDAKKGMITLTYDYNTSDFQKLIGDTSVYTPKVISARIKK